MVCLILVFKTRKKRNNHVFPAGEHDGRGSSKLLGPETEPPGGRPSRSQEVGSGARKRRWPPPGKWKEKSRADGPETRQLGVQAHSHVPQSSSGSVSSACPPWKLPRAVL